MADATPAAPAAPTPAQAAVDTVTQTLPKDQKKPAQAVETRGDEVTEDDGSDLVAEGAPAAQKKAEAAAKRAYKLKVGGKDLEVDEAELVKRAQMGYSAEQKWQDAAKIQKQTQEFVALMQRDPAKALEMMGYDVDKLAEDRIKAKIEEMQKSPEQLEREKMQRELEEMKAEREREKQESQSREMQRIQDQFAIEIENDISAALDNNSYGFPKTPYVVKRIADTMLLAVQEGLRTNNDKLKNITAKDVLPIVRDEILSEQRELYSMTPDEVFETLIGKERLNKYRRSKIKKTAPKTGSANEVKQTGTRELQRQAEERDKGAKKISAKDFFKSLGSGKV
jgi:hypothetical protein